MKETTLNKEQKQALYMMDSGKNVFLNGKAGSGKSFVINEFIKNNPHKNIALLAPTGLAASQIGGMTIHKFFSLSSTFLPSHKLSFMKEHQRNKIRITDTFVIDEISMVSADLLFAMEKRVKSVTNNNLPWGGKQIIVCGDFGQLPPVIPYQYEYLFLKKYNGYYAFNSPSWKTANLLPIELTISNRQKDSLFQATLDIMSCLH